jgi:2-keto-3-deoxy-L-rhamnonate aldolase RhmA
MATRINRAIELLAQDQPIYYSGGHTGHVLTREQGRKDAHIWSDYINVGFEHGSMDFAGLAEYLAGMVEGGPTNSGHRTPTVIVEAPVNGINEEYILFNAWQFRQILGRGAHGILLCQAETAGAARAFVESCRYPQGTIGTDPSFATPLERLKGADRGRPGMKDGRPLLGLGTRGRGSESTASHIWGVPADEYTAKADPWPLNPDGELLLGLKLESPEGIARAEEILAVPGIGFAEMGPGDLSHALGYKRMPGRDSYPPEMQEAREKVFGLCKKYGVAFLEGAPDAAGVRRRIDEGVRIFSGHSEENAKAGREYSKRTMPVG